MERKDVDIVKKMQYILNRTESVVKTFKLR